MFIIAENDEDEEDDCRDTDKRETIAFPKHMQMI